MTEATKSETPVMQYIENEMLINEEFKIWKKSVPLLYDTIQTYPQETPSLTIETLPDFEFSADNNELEVKFLSGTYTNAADKENYLLLNSIRLPSTLSPKTRNSIPIPTGQPLFPKFNVLQKWKHPGEVNKARYNKFNNKIATFTKTGDVKLFTFNQEEALATLKFHKKDGFGLEWGIDNNLLLTGGEDSLIALWDVEKSTAEPTSVYQYHDSIINDFAWNHEIKTLFGSVSDDCSVQFIDTRSSNNSEPLLKIPEAHKDVINAIEFNPKLSNLFVTGSADNLVSVWDLRNLNQPLRNLYGHHSAINQLKFSPDEPNLLASSSNDRRIHIWDLQKLDEDFDLDDFIKNETEDPCLKFVHGGHTAKVSEFIWITGLSNTVISAGEDRLIQIWKPHFEEEEEDEEDEEEQGQEQEDKEAVEGEVESKDAVNNEN